MNEHARRSRSALFTLALLIGLSGLAGCKSGGGGGGDGAATPVGSTPGTTTSATSGTNSAPTNSETAASGSTSSGIGVTLSWTAPMENVDGTPLTNLAGYVIAYGTSSDAMSQSVRLDNPSLDRYVFDQLSTGTYFFAIKAVNAEGAESALSAVVTKQIS